VKGEGKQTFRGKKVPVVSLAKRGRINWYLKDQMEGGGEYYTLAIRKGINTVERGA